MLITFLVGGLEHFFSPYIGKLWEAHHPNWLSYFSDWLKPPTSFCRTYTPSNFEASPSCEPLAFAAQVLPLLKAHWNPKCTPGICWSGTVWDLYRFISNVWRNHQRNRKEMERGRWKKCNSAMITVTATCPPETSGSTSLLHQRWRPRDARNSESTLPTPLQNDHPNLQPQSYRLLEEVLEIYTPDASELLWQNGLFTIPTCPLIIMLPMREVNFWISTFASWENRNSWRSGG